MNSLVRYALIAILLAFTYSAFAIGGVFAVLGLYASGYVFYQLLTEENRWIPIGEIGLSMGAFQWIIAPMISYTIPNPMFQMSQSCNEYMMNTVPMFICFAIGYYCSRKPFTYSVEDLQEVCLNSEKLAKTFILVGIICTLIPIPISALAQIVKFFSQLMFVGTIMLMLAYPNGALRKVILPMGIMFYLSLRSGMFHELMTWGLMMMLVLFKINQLSLVKKVVIILLALFVVNTIQTIKTTYRSATWNGSGGSIALFVNLMINNTTISQTAATEKGNDTNSRYNQGWIISAIYDNVPSRHDYFYGRTFKDAFVATLLPRFIVPNKKGAGEQSRADFQEMTGYVPARNTSMGLSILGESYGNFGFWGGIVFMFLWGIFIAKVIGWTNWLSRRNYLWVMFLPIICFNLIKAEISMMSVLNWTIKGLVFAWIVIYLYNNYRNSHSLFHKKV